MTPELHQWVSQRPLLRALLQEEGVTWLQVTPSGEIWVRRGQQPRALTPIELSSEEVTGLHGLIREAMERHRQLCDPGGEADPWLEWRNMRWMLLGEPLHKGAPALFAQRIRAPRVDAQAWVARGWARRDQMELLSQRLAHGRGLLLAGPEEEALGQLAATLLADLPETRHALLLESSRGLDTEGLPVTALRRAVASQGSQSQLCQLLLENADLLVVCELASDQGWRWACLPGPQARLLSVKAASAQEAARALITEVLAQRPEQDALRLPQDLNLDTLVFCRATPEGFSLELSAFPERALGQETRYIPLKPLSTTAPPPQELTALSLEQPRDTSPLPQQDEVPTPVPMEVEVTPSVMPMEVEVTPSAVPTAAQQLLSMPEPTTRTDALPVVLDAPAADVAAPPEELVPLPDLPSGAPVEPSEEPTPALEVSASASLADLSRSPLSVELDVADVDDHSSFDEPSSRSDEEMPSGPSLADRLRRRLGRPPKPRAWKNTQERFTGSTEVTPAPASIEDSGERRSLAPASRLGGAMNRRLARPVQRPLPTESPAGGEAATPRASNRRRARFGTSAIKRQTRFNPVEPEQRKVGLRSIGRQEEGFEVHLGGAASSDEGATQQRDLPNDDLATIQKAAQELGSFLEASPDEATIQKSPRELSRGVAQDAEPRDPPGRSSPTIPIRLDPPEEP